jgi:UDPglucose 6-dehydrogenase
MSHDWFEAVMLQRERHAEWLARLIVERAGALPVVVLGRAFKAESAIETGSPALLLLSLLAEAGCSATSYDPLIDPVGATPTSSPACYFVATMHRAFATFPFPAGSVVIDPWRYVPDRTDVEVVRIGERPLK